MMRKTAVIILAGALGAFHQAQATSLLPGQTITNPGALPGIDIPSASSTAISSTGSASLLEEGSSWKVGTKTGANITFANGVWIDPTTGNLDFFYQIQNTFKGTAAANNTVLRQFELGDFGGVQITGVFEVTYSTTSNGCAFFGAGPCPPDSNGSGFLRPTTGVVESVARSSGFGDDLTITFSGNGIAPGTNSAILVIQTNANDFDQSGSGTFFWKGAPPSGAVGSGPGQNTKGPWILDALEPIITPEPSAYGVLFLAIGGLMAYARRRAKKAKSAAVTAA
jgi:hypothetical protein